MNHLVQDLVGVSVYLDDLLIFPDSWEQHIHQLAVMFHRLQETRLTVKLAKTTFGLLGAPGGAWLCPSQSRQRVRRTGVSGASLQEGDTALPRDGRFLRPVLPELRGSSRPSNGTN